MHAQLILFFFFFGANKFYVNHQVLTEISPDSFSSFYLVYLRIKFLTVIIRWKVKMKMHCKPSYNFRPMFIIRREQN